MNRLKYILLLLALFAAGCEKVIHVDLNNANPEIVIEALLHDNENSCRVNISETGSYFEPYNKHAVTGADIVLSDSEGHIFNFNDNGDGVYQSDSFTPVYGQLYTISVDAGGKTYQASSYLNRPVPVNSLSSEYRQGTLFFDSGYIVTCNFTDPAGTPDYYRIKISVNGQEDSSPYDYYVFKDEFFNGKTIGIPLQRQLFNPGDTVRVELLRIDEAAYDYFNTLESILGSSSAGSAAPANPVSNFSNNALGYFSAYSSSGKTIIIQK